ncbi:hypothetical protein VTN00DRAFT_3248 [Thermoascus crustaceus]|uniref:uncharacterized protein n=1 Tax=Thermoascus crustaceus TaxID=5088 RepID=UPI0037438D88
MPGRNVSHGRGGAGNMYSDAAPTTPKDLVTPTIKQDIYTTGRGGSGNMMQNDPEHPEIARESQDVEAPPQRLEEGRHFTGRGGVANAYIPPPEEEQKLSQVEEQIRRQSRAHLRTDHPPQIPATRTLSRDSTAPRAPSKDRAKELLEKGEEMILGHHLHHHNHHHHEHSQNNNN